MARSKAPGASKTAARVEVPEELPSTPAVAPKNIKARGITPQITQADIARRAYEIYQARGGQHGRHEEDWQQAERELKLGPQ